MSSPKILTLDIETAPVLARVWGLRDQNVSVNQIKKDWFILSWAAKWRGDSKMHYADLRQGYKTQDDKRILGKLWKLLDAADIVIAQNGKRFDIPKLNARFLINGFQRPSHYKVIDTCQQARRIFGFTSNSLEYLAKTLLKEKKGSHKNFPGQDLWNECLAGNQAAWKEMEEYNKKDVILCEKLFEKMLPWDNSTNFDVYRPGRPTECDSCGPTKFQARGVYYTGTNAFQTYRCVKCGKSKRSPTGNFNREDQASIGRGFK